jgi:hypothetical protein
MIKAYTFFLIEAIPLCDNIEVYIYIYVYTQQ